MFYSWYFLNENQTRGIFFSVYVKDFLDVYNSGTKLEDIPLKLYEKKKRKKVIKNDEICNTELIIVHLILFL